MIRTSSCFAALLLLGAAATAQEQPTAFGGGRLPSPSERLPADYYQQLGREIEATRDWLAFAGILPAPEPEMTITFSWPLRMNGIGYFSGYGTSNFVDQNAAAGILDYNCTARTYEGHAGTDFFTWPFGWLNMDEERVEVVAAAPGVILSRVDGNFDRNCDQNTVANPNQIILQHADGSIAGYLHLKNGSVTPKVVGQSVVAGEYLGVVGSSGPSSGPHLHFEVHEAGTFPGPLRDPFDGACETLTPGSLWVTQPAYRNPRVNHLATATAIPGFPTCPAEELPHEKRLFADGDPIFFVEYLADETTAFTKTMRLLRPDGSEFSNWQHTTDQNLDAVWWYWTWASFPAGQAGRWTFSVSLNGVTRTRAFWIDAIFADDFEDANPDAWSVTVP
ncbi:MAG: M23 family metallopeptidase [Thermoanaerobaculia bacterium]